MESQNASHHAQVATSNAPGFPGGASIYHSTAEDINPRDRKRRRTDSRVSINSIVAADHQELADLYSHTALSYNSSAGVPLQSLDVANDEARHAPDSPREMEPVDMVGIYSYAHKEMTAQVQRPQSPVKYEADLGYGPYHAQYWSFLQGDLNAGTPQHANGGYQSPYSSLASDPYYPAPPGASVGLPEDVVQDSFHGNEAITPFSRPQQYSTLATDASNVYPSPIDNFGWQYPTVEPVPHAHNLGILKNLATQILSTLWSSTVHDFSTIASSLDGEKGQSFANLEHSFEQSKKSFIRDQLFIDPASIQPTSPAVIRTIRKTNIATFVLCAFRGRDVPFLDLNESFLDIFMPTGTRLFKTEGALFLELKTQAYIAVMLSTDLAREDVLDQFFPRDLQLVILRRRPEPTHLAPSEQDFISRINTRRQYLQAGSDDMEALSQLPRKYNWTDFLEEVRVCVGRALECLDGSKRSAAPNSGFELFLFRIFEIIACNNVNETNGSNRHHTSTAPNAEDPITKATLAAHAAISGHSPNGYSNTFHSPSIQHIPSFSDETHSHKRKRNLSDSSKDSSSISPKTPTAPMQHQYEAARATTHPKATPFTNRRPGAPSQRRPWSQEEEKALMDGLDRVKGPHWSQILALYGPGGSISEILKDRNQVQLKDKARNLKLFFLKSGIEVPVYLTRVTGELKTRAPAQAAKIEARERLKALEDKGIRRVE
ncbi:hypothetical protein EJ08DRAFT_662223 [Tothia fuscella]|uniref:HTH myb-type domain-containing protein n=1 Tax=Tothia fuscella TaxID=1048955 RepID=A0A9P4NNQ1_9PEZI|nr:hypothetical protein EJ08DRAFT_662223 [Tothia fuscella]